MKVILCLCLSLSFAAFVLGQDGATTRPVTNEDILQLSRAGVLPAVVIAKIKNSECKFDTSPAALVALKEAGVSDEILMEMVRNPSDVAPRSVAPQPTPENKEKLKAKERSNFGDNLPEYGDISEIRRMRRVFVIADDIDSQNRLINSLSGYKGLQVVNSPDDAEIFVAFSQGSLATSMEFRGLFAGTIDYRTKAQFIVYYRSERGRSRIVWRETEDIQTTSGLTFSRPNEVNVIRHFIKELKKIRGE